MKRAFLLLFALFLTSLIACGVQADTVPVPDSSVSDIPQETPSAQEELETDSAALSALRLEASELNCPCAVACLSFETDEASLSAVIDALRDRYPFLSDTYCADAGGEEVYLIVPTDPAAQTSLYCYALNASGEIVFDDTAFANAADGSIVLLRCNISDILPNTLVRITDSNGAMFEFSPYLSLEDGHIHIDGVYDFTAYPADMPDT